MDGQDGRTPPGTTETEDIMNLYALFS